ncbi:MAG TPA: hypothetical protein VFV19_05070 [Candidatus Polarisedimenticolaceae bacterium]|nr:hypothetical protein [Candidatus Polarisedimenticolaceae bacterium]
MFGLLLLAMVLVVPLMLVGLFLRLVFAVVFLPIRLAAFGLKLTFGLVFGLLGLVVGGIGLAIAFLVFGAILIVPLLPFLLLAGAVWLMWRLLRRRKLQPTYTVS